jgi:hypothetical protein
MLDHHLKCIPARLFAQLGVQRDVPSKENLNPRSDVAKDGTGAYNDPPHNTEVFHDTVSVKLKVCCDK